MNKLIIISEYFQPSEAATAQLATDLALYISSYHANTHIVTTSIGSPLPNLHIHRISGSARTHNILAKIFKASRFYVASLIWLFKNCRRGDTLVIFSNPPFIVSAGYLVNLFFQAKFIFIFQDLFPQSASLAGVLPTKGLIKNIWISLFRICLRSSSSTVVLSEAMKKRFHYEFGFDLNCTVIHNWAPSENEHSNYIPTPKSQSKKTFEWQLQDVFAVQYSGNFGRMHDLVTLLEAARLLKSEPIKFVFIGDGPKKEQILLYKKVYDLHNIALYPYQDRSNLVSSLTSADLSVVSLSPGADDIVAPSKVYGILSSARPVLLIANPQSCLAKTLESSRSGVVVQPGEVQALANEIKYLSENPLLTRKMGENAYLLYHTRYRRILACEKYRSLINSIQR